MKTVINVDKATIPDCCISCQELNVDFGTLTCNIDGCDALPFQKCNEFKRLKFYGEHKEPYTLAA